MEESNSAFFFFIFNKELKKMEKKMLSVKEMQTALGIGRTLALKLVASKEIPSVRLGRRILIPVAALDRVLSEGGK